MTPLPSIERSPKVTVIVVGFNGAQWVERCFGSIKQSLYKVSAILVDNHSADNTVDLVLKDFPEVAIISNQENAGFGKANNQGITKALADGADYIFLLNQDAWLEPETVGTLVKIALRNPAYGVISPMHFTGSGEKLDYNFRHYLAKDFSEHKIEAWTHQAEYGVYPAQFINAAAWMISRQCLEQIGGFGRLFFHYGEDYDFIHRMNFFHLKLGVTPAVKIFHDRESRTRNAFQNDSKTLLHYFYTGSLVRIADVRQSFLSALGGVFFWNLKELAFLFFRGKSRAPAVFAEVMWKILMNTKDIQAYRTQISVPQDFRFL